MVISLLTNQIILHSFKIQIVNVYFSVYFAYNRPRSAKNKKRRDQLHSDCELVKNVEMVEKQEISAIAAADATEAPGLHMENENTTMLTQIKLDLPDGAGA